MPHTFVLVHGAWHGGWCWRRVADRLHAGGHAVFTPTLTGLGERAHLMRAGIGLDAHIADVVNAITCEGLGDVVHFIRYAAAVKGRGARVIAACPDSLVRLVARCPGVDAVQDWYAPVPDCDVAVPFAVEP